MAMDSLQSCCDDQSCGLDSVETVRAEVLALVSPAQGRVHVGLAGLAGRTLAQDVFATIDLPVQDHSAVDGYALGPASGTGRFRICARTAAGEAPLGRAVGENEAVQVFTGAPIPPGTVAVAMQEHCERDMDALVVPQVPGAGQNIRRRGEDVAQGELLLSATSRLDPRHIAVLAALGIAGADVMPRPKVAVFSSGKELCDPGNPLGAAAIYDSNRWMIKALLEKSDVEIIDLGIQPDDPKEIAETLRGAALKVDLILSTGGVSVGEEDHMAAAIKRAGGDPMQRKIAVKPGKPVVFGRIGGAIVLALPGNPVAALVSFLHLARPVMAALSGPSPMCAPTALAVAAFNWQRRAGRKEFFPARCIGLDECGRPMLEKIGRGGSARLRPLVQAEGLAAIAGDVSAVEPGDILEWHPFTGDFNL